MKAWHIVAYTFNAEIYCPDHVEEWAWHQLRIRDCKRREIEESAQRGPSFDCGIIAHRAEGMLWKLAELKGIDYGDSASYDSGDFPKPIFASDEIEKYCGAGHAM